MTEWWVSTKKNWCEICRVWTGGHIQQILKHKNGRMHIEHEEQMLKDARKRETEKQKSERDLKDELARIERAAAEAMTREAVAGLPAGVVSVGRGTAAAAAGANAQQQLERFEEKLSIVATVEAAKRRRVEASGVAVEPAPGTCAWTRHTDPGSGYHYYYNASAGQSSWQEPPEYAAAVAAAVAAVAEAAAPATATAAVCPAVRGVTPEATASAETMENMAPASAETLVHMDVGAERTGAASSGPLLGKPVPRSTGSQTAATPVGMGATSGFAPIAAASRGFVAGARGTPSPGPATQPRPVIVSANDLTVPGAQIGAWTVCTDPGSGHVYYYNRSAGTSTWEKPADLGGDLCPQQAQPEPPGPPTSLKPPPPPPRRKQDAAPGAWEEVAPEESQFGRPEDERPARGEDSDEEESHMDALANAKRELMGRRGEWAPEDRQLREKEAFTKRSSVAAGAGEPAPAFPLTRQRAVGVRRRTGGQE